MNETQQTNSNPTTTRAPISDRADLGRRPLLKTLGLGAALAAGAGRTGAAGTDSSLDDDADSRPEIDPVYGHATPDAESVPADVPDHEVELHIGDPSPGAHGPLFHFEPTGLSIAPGDVVQFTFTTPDHTITAYHPGHGFQRRVPEGVPPFSSPVVNAGGAWLYQFREAGLYDLYCAPHHVLGMAMRIVVGALEGAAIPDYEDTFEVSEEPPLLAPFNAEMLQHELETFSEPGENVRSTWVWLTPREVLDAGALDPTNVQRQGAVPFDDVLDDLERIDGGHEHE